MRKILFLMTGAVMLFLASCRSTKQITAEPGARDSVSHVVAALTAGSKVPAGPVSAKMNVEVGLGSQKVTLGGSLRMKPDALVQLSLTAFFMEVARVEFTPDYVLLLDRMGRQYVKVAYDEVNFLKESGLDFSTVQALFRGELFLPGKKGIPQEGDFERDFRNGMLYLLARGNDLLRTQFVVQQPQCLVRTHISGKTNQANVLEWSYLHYENKGRPDKMQIMLHAAGKEIRANLNLSQFRSQNDLEPTAVPADKYRRVSAQMLLDKLWKR